MALSDGKCRICQKSFFEEIEICLLFQILRIVFDQTEYQFFNQINGSKIMIVARRKIEFIMAILIGLIVIFKNLKCTKALTL